MSADPAEVVRRLVAAFNAFDIDTVIALSSPDVVSQWTRARCVIAGFSASARSTVAGSTGWSSGQRSASAGRPSRRAISIMRSP